MAEDEELATLLAFLSGLALFTLADAALGAVLRGTMVADSLEVGADAGAGGRVEV
jgi:hypothetical protein